MLLRWTFSLLALFLHWGCGQDKLVEIKDFRIFVDSEDAVLNKTVEGLVKRYNQEYGKDVLKLTRSQTESNSIISFRDDLRMDGQKLGTGQWVTTTTQAKAMSLHGEVTTIQVEFGMELIFDEGNFLNKAYKAVDEGSTEAQHLFHLFSHEVGHGMQMDHDDDRQSVMFPTIPEKPNREIDYKKYFQRVTQFVGHQDHLAPRDEAEQNGEGAANKKFENQIIRQPNKLKSSR